MCTCLLQQFILVNAVWANWEKLESGSKKFVLSFILLLLKLATTSRN